MDQKLIAAASLIGQRAQELEEHLSMLDAQIKELHMLKEGISSLETGKVTETISSLGKGVHVKTSIIDSKLFVEVGDGVVVRKTPKDTKEIIIQQIHALMESRKEFMQQLQEYYNELQKIVQQARG